MKPKTMIAIVAAVLFCALLQMPPADAQAEQLFGLASKAVPMIIMQGVKEYKKATNPAYAKAERERPKGQAEDDAFLDGDNFSGEWQQLQRQNTHIKIQEDAASVAAQATRDEAAKKDAKAALLKGAKVGSEPDVKEGSTDAAKPVAVARPRDREGSDWFMDDDEASTRKISAKVSKPKSAEQDDEAASTASTHTEIVQGKLLKSPMTKAGSTKPSVTESVHTATAKNKNADAEKAEATQSGSEIAPIIMMPISK